MAARIQVKPIPMDWSRGKNYAYFVRDLASGDSLVIDPAQPKEVLPQLSTLLSQPESRGKELKFIVNTHHHYDHSDGNKALKEKYPAAQLVAGKDSPLVEYTPEDGHSVKLGEWSFQACKTPCHTQDSICWFLSHSESNEKYVFTGDTLFLAGCGRFFEGTAEEMFKALKRLGEFPSETKVCPGHEYTLGNVKFAKTVLEGEAFTQICELENIAQESEYTPTLTTIGQELGWNPFMMCENQQLQRRLNAGDAIQAMQTLRELKNNF